MDQAGGLAQVGRAAVRHGLGRPRQGALGEVSREEREREGRKDGGRAAAARRRHHPGACGVNSR